MTKGFEFKTGDDATAALSHVLIESGLDLSLWGQPDTKSVADLVADINAGESELFEDENGLYRVANGLGLDVFATVDGKRYYLVEERQVFTNGQERRRDLSTSLGEKIKRGESILDVVTRALDEELGLDLGDVAAIEIGGGDSRERVSNSYPGLRSVVTIHHAVVEISSGQFCREGYVEVQEKKSTFLVWHRVTAEDD